MSWFAVDDRFHQHRKVIRLRRSASYGGALALWTLSGSWAAGDQQARLSGAVPLDVVESFGVDGTYDAIDALVSCGLWSCDGESVFFHNWSLWNGPDAKAQRMEQRLANDRMRQRRSRATRTSQTVSRDGHVTTGTGRDGSGRDGSGTEDAASVHQDVGAPALPVTLLADLGLGKAAS